MPCTALQNGLRTATIAAVALMLPVLATATTVTWSTWAKTPDPVWQGWAIAADPTVIHDGAQYRMFFTQWLENPGRLVIDEAVSADGLQWADVHGVSGTPPVLDSVPGAWDAFMETPFIMKVGSEYFLYYGGYPANPPVGEVSHGELGLARSTDGINFTRHGTGPILTRTPGGLDNDAIFSPSIVWWENEYWLIYAAHCWTDCGGAAGGVRLLGARSPDGINWTKVTEPVLDSEMVAQPWAAAWVGEATLRQGPDDLFYLFFTAFSGVDGTDEVIAVGRSPHPFGPWDIAPDPILQPGDPGQWDDDVVIAPEVLFENGKARLWYMGQPEATAGYSIGYAESPLPLMTIDTPWQTSPANPMITPLLDPPGAVADFAVADPCVIFDDATGSYRAWYSTALELADGSEMMAIRHADSPDGLSWTVSPTPVMTSQAADSLAWDFTHSETPFVIKDPTAAPDRRYLMYYSGGNLIEDPLGESPFYETGLAYSSDGLSFQRLPANESPYGQAGLILRGRDLFPQQPSVAKGVVADPTVIRDSDGTWRLWASGYGEDAVGQLVVFGISHATSPDGIHWTPTPDNPLSSLARPGEIAAGMQPSVIWDPDLGRYEMWLTNDRTPDEARVPATLFHAFGFWHATSYNGIDWTPDYGPEPDLRWDATDISQRWGLFTGVHALLVGGDVRLYYTAWSALDVPPLYYTPTPMGLVPSIPALCMVHRPRDPAPTAVADPSLPTAQVQLVAEPNPFNSATEIAFVLSQRAGVRLRVYDLRGGLVRNLAAGTYAAGRHAVTWRGRSDDGRAQASGMYLAVLEAEGVVATQKLVLVQ